MSENSYLECTKKKKPKNSNINKNEQAHKNGVWN